MRIHTTLKGLIMFILACVLTFVLSCTLVFLYKYWRNVMTDIRYMTVIRNRARRVIENYRAVKDDDTKTYSEKLAMLLR